MQNTCEGIWLSQVFFRGDMTVYPDQLHSEYEQEYKQENEHIAVTCPA